MPARSASHDGVDARNKSGHDGVGPPRQTGATGDGAMDSTLILIDDDAELARARALVEALWDSERPEDLARLEAQARLIRAGWLRFARHDGPSLRAKRSNPCRRALRLPRIPRVFGMM
jgi:hypothetical protein